MCMCVFCTQSEESVRKKNLIASVLVITLSMDEFFLYETRGHGHIMLIFYSKK